MKIMTCLFVILMLVVSLPAIPQPHADDALRGQINAQRDAKNDANRVAAFFFGGMGGCSLTMGFLMISLANDGLLGASVSSEDQTILYGLGACGLLDGAMPILFDLRDAVPPADRFIGKSSAYVDAYSSTYPRSVRMRRAPITLLGYTIGRCLLPYLGARYYVD